MEFAGPQNKAVWLCAMGKVEYRSAWALQMHLHSRIVEQKLANRKRDGAELQPTENFLLLCEHNPVFTLGKSGNPGNLLLSESLLHSKGVDFVPINRGGDITYHGPGQLTGYPILDLANFFTDIGKYLRLMEEAIIQVLDLYGLRGERIEGLTGVWLDASNPARARKICAIGVHSSRWVTMHGFAFNICTDLSPFSYIVPCGIPDKGVTSLDHEVDGVVYDRVVQQTVQAFARVYEMELKTCPPVLWPAQYPQPV
jgi:lipoyl(octanoyl) transferase